MARLQHYQGRTTTMGPWFEGSSQKRLGEAHGMDLELVAMVTH